MKNESNKLISRYVSNILFSDATENEIFIDGNPYRRPTRIYDNNYINFDKPLSRQTATSNSALSTHRLLLNVYEADCLFLPEIINPKLLADLNLFYSAENIANGETIRPILEKKAFSFLDEEISITGQWTAESLIKFCNEFLEDEKQARGKSAEEDALFSTILHSSDPKRCARHYLVQLAPDFLSEASAMARMAPGAYGSLQSSIFNILIDEYGASVHRNKHSTLFANTMKSVGLNSQIHYYWQFYHAMSLCLTNYFHYITKNKGLFFRYVGALFYTEASLVNVTKQQSQMLRKVFGSNIDTKYFDEHHHIDQHHGQMALKNVIEPALSAYGDIIASEILRGFLEFRYLEGLASEDLIAQYQFFDTMSQTAKIARQYYNKIVDKQLDVPLETFVECAGERSTTHVHPDDRLLVIENGKMDFWPLLGEPMKLKAGDILAIPKHRLHGSVVISDECIYHQPIADASEMRVSIA